MNEVLSDLKEMGRHLAQIVLRWLLWTKWHFLATVTVLFAIIIVVGSLTHATKRSSVHLHRPAVLVIPTSSSSDFTSSPAAPSTQPETNVPPRQSSTYRTSISAAPTTSRPTRALVPDPTAVTVATKFVVAWAHHQHVTKARWLAGLSPYATSVLRDRLSATQLANVPSNRVTGKTTVVTSADGQIEFQVPTDTRPVVVVVNKSTKIWQVSSVEVT
jgi:hypothetical protein